MGEYAEMMLDGTCCATCGEFFHDGDAFGVPRYCCRECEPDGFRPARKKFSCQMCERKFGSEAAATQHARDKHVRKISGRASAP
jgi:hypothetical protein